MAVPTKNQPSVTDLLVALVSLGVVQAPELSGKGVPKATPWLGFDTITGSVAAGITAGLTTALADFPQQLYETVVTSELDERHKRVYLAKDLAPWADRLRAWAQKEGRMPQVAYLQSKWALPTAAKLAQVQGIAKVYGGIKIAPKDIWTLFENPNAMAEILDTKVLLPFLRDMRRRQLAATLDRVGASLAFRLGVRSGQFFKEHKIPLSFVTWAMANKVASATTRPFENISRAISRLLRDDVKPPREFLKKELRAILGDGALVALRELEGELARLKKEQIKRESIENLIRRKLEGAVKNLRWNEKEVKDFFSNLTDFYLLSEEVRRAPLDERSDPIRRRLVDKAFETAIGAYEIESRYTPTNISNFKDRAENLKKAQRKIDEHALHLLSEPATRKGISLSKIYAQYSLLKAFSESNVPKLKDPIEWLKTFALGGNNFFLLAGVDIGLAGPGIGDLAGVLDGLYKGLQIEDRRELEKFMKSFVTSWKGLFGSLDDETREILLQDINLRAILEGNIDSSQLLQYVADIREKYRYVYDSAGGNPDMVKTLDPFFANIKVARFSYMAGVLHPVAFVKHFLTGELPYYLFYMGTGFGDPIIIQALASGAGDETIMRLLLQRFGKMESKVLWSLFRLGRRLSHSNFYLKYAKFTKWIGKGIYFIRSPHMALFEQYNKLVALGIGRIRVGLSKLAAKTGLKKLGQKLAGTLIGKLFKGALAVISNVAWIVYFVLNFLTGGLLDRILLNIIFFAILLTIFLPIVFILYLWSFFSVPTGRAAYATLPVTSRQIMIGSTNTSPWAYENDESVILLSSGERYYINFSKKASACLSTRGCKPVTDGYSNDKVKRFFKLDYVYEQSGGQITSMNYSFNVPHTWRMPSFIKGRCYLPLPTGTKPIIVIHSAGAEAHYKGVDVEEATFFAAVKYHHNKPAYGLLQYSMVLLPKKNKLVLATKDALSRRSCAEFYTRERPVVSVMLPANYDLRPPTALEIERLAKLVAALVATYYDPSEWGDINWLNNVARFHREQNLIELGNPIKTCPGKKFTPELKQQMLQKALSYLNEFK